MKAVRAQLATALGAPTWMEANLSSPRLQDKALWGMVRKYTGHPLLVHFLSALIADANVPARDPQALAEAIQNYSVEHIKFFRERPERFQSPMRSIVWGLGDCDDKAIFIAAATRTFRIPTQLEIIRMRIHGRDVGHVYPKVYLEGAWIPLESVRAYPWGHDPAKIAKRRGFLVSTNVVGDKADDGVYA